MFSSGISFWVFGLVLTRACLNRSHLACNSESEPFVDYGHILGLPHVLVILISIAAIRELSFSAVLVFES